MGLYLGKGLFNWNPEGYRSDHAIEIVAGGHHIDAYETNWFPHRATLG
jgi:hypothetical protein